MSFTSSASGTVSAVPVVVGEAGTLYTPSISNAGVVTLTSGATYTGAEQLATFEDSNGLDWFWMVDLTNGGSVGTSLRRTMGTRFTRLSVRINFTAPAGLLSSEEFRLYRLAPTVGLMAQLPDRYQTLVDTYVYRCSLKIKHGGSALVVSNLRVVAQVRRPQLVSS